MTFSALQGQTTNSPLMTSDYVPSGTDEAEAIRFKESMTHFIPVGESVDYSEDFADAGFTREDNV